MQLTTQGMPNLKSGNEAAIGVQVSYFAGPELYLSYLYKVDYAGVIKLP